MRNPASAHTTTAAGQRWKIAFPRGKADEASQLHQELSNSLKIQRGKDKLKNRMETIEDVDFVCTRAGIGWPAVSANDQWNPD